MIDLQTHVRIARPVEEVFTYVADPTRYPRWNSAVQSVRAVVGAAAEATYSMKRELPGGPVENTLVIVALDRPRGFDIRTTSGPTPFLYRYRFTEQDGTALVQLAAQVELSAPAFFAPLARLAVKKGVDDNLNTLKKILEA